MSTKHYCDKCGRELQRNKENLELYKIVVKSYNIDKKYYDLCSDCYKKLLKWLKE